MSQAIDSVTQSLPISDEAKQNVSDKAHTVQNQVGEQVKGQVGQRASQAGEQVGAVSTALHSTSEQLRNEGQDGPARIVEQAAAKGDQLSSYLAKTDPNEILADVESFCREQPWVVIAGGIALGFLGARFLKSSSSRRYESRYYSSNGYNSSPNARQRYARGYNGASGYGAVDRDIVPASEAETADDPLRAGTDVYDGTEPYSARDNY